MLNCDLCEYFKTAQSRNQNASKCVCEITGFVFHKNPEDYELENYPCYDYQVNNRVEAEEKIIMVEVKEKKLA